MKLNILLEIKYLEFAKMVIRFNPEIQMTDRLNYSPNTDKFEEKQKWYPFCADLIYNIDSPLKSTLSISKSNNQRLMSRGKLLLAPRLRILN